MLTANVKTQEGNLPILISSPHAFSHKRPSLMLAYKLGEPWTREIAQEVATDISCFGIFQEAESDYDPNFHDEKRNPYKQKVKELVECNKIKRFVDIHGLREGAGYDIAIFYTTRFVKSIKFAEQMAQGLDFGHLKGVSIRIFRFLDNDQETLGEYVASKLRIPAIQIEIARYIRDEEMLRTAFIDNLARTLKEKI